MGHCIEAKLVRWTIAFTYYYDGSKYKRPWFSRRFRPIAGRAIVRAMNTESAICEWLAGQREAMTALLREMVDIDSGSYNKAGIDAVGGLIEAFLTGQGIATKTGTGWSPRAVGAILRREVKPRRVVVAAVA